MLTLSLSSVEVFDYESEAQTHFVTVAAGFKDHIPVEVDHQGTLQSLVGEPPLTLRAKLEMYYFQSATCRSLFI